MNLRRLFAVWHARNLEFLRDRSTLVFNFLFPLALVVAFAVIFGGQPRALFKVDVVAPAHAALDAGLHPFLGTRYVDFVRIDARGLAAAIRKVERHQVDLLLDLRAAPRYWINEDSPKGYLAEKLLLESAAGRAAREPVSGAAVRYVDWLLPGILGMNMMFSCLFGVGYVVVRYRKSGFLRRLSATPVTAFEFGAAQVLSRLLLTVSVTSLLYGALALFVPFRNDGSVGLLLVVAIAGALAMIAFGFMMA
ncbi:MAG: ABC transporter permease, partial [Steroidobacteraceae bacterium]